MTGDERQYLETRGVSDELVVVLHGFANDDERLHTVRQTIRGARPDADIYAPALPFRTNKRCTDSAPGIVARLMTEVDRLVSARRASGRPYRRITFVGHSMGAVLARRLVITAFGEQRDPAGDVPAPFEPELAQFRQPRAWARSIQRVVLLAGMNRGWTTSSAMSWLASLGMSVMQLAAEFVYSGKLTIFALRKGAPFLVQTRLQWLALMDPRYGPRPDLVAVQLLGTIDDHVSPDDSIDFSVDAFGKSQSYFYVEVGQSNHGGVIRMCDRSGGAGSAAAERRGKFLLALEADRETLARVCVTREQMADTLPQEPNPAVTDLVFVVHGIRDKGFWTQKIARTIKRQAPAGTRFESWTESYGYFAMLPFLFRNVRQRKVEWLMDRYAEARARFPNAAFHYVGHSNGTYLAAQALQDYPAARFKRIVFAGSVVRCDYDWKALMQPTPSAPAGRVGQVLNYVATTDWVVALFPKALQPWRWFNLGGAGHDGFAQAAAGGPVHQVTYIEGAHGAGHDETHWNDIARFIVTGKPPALGYPPLSRAQSRVLKWFSCAAWLLFPVLVLLVLGAGAWLLYGVFASTAAAGAAGFTVAFFVYLWFVYLAVTRF